MRDDFSSEPDVPIGELTDEPSPRRGARSGSRARRTVAVAAAAVLVAGGVAYAVRATNDGGNGSRRVVTPTTTRRGSGGEARVAVGAALQRTVATGSFDLRFRLSATAGTVPDASACPPSAYCPLISQRPYTISGTATVSVNPTAMVSHADLPGLGPITTRVDGTQVWEDGGGNYGMVPGSGGGPGQPLSGFAGLVQGTLGPREGAIAMNSLASPTGYLDLADASITSARKLDTDVVDGVSVQRYVVGIDTMRELDRPDLTPEETKTMQAALALLQQQGYRSTTVQLSVDGLGLIRRAQTTVAFANGGTVAADVTFSNFGCSTVELHANGPWIVPKPSGCVAAAPASTTTTAVVPDVPSSNAPEPTTTSFATTTTEVDVIGPPTTVTATSPSTTPSTTTSATTDS